MVQAVSKAWFCIPSARPVAEVIPVVRDWSKMGYGVALQRDSTRPFDEAAELQNAGASVFIRPYGGYADAVNFLTRQILRSCPEVDWCVAGGDDTFPDPNKTGDEIAEECSRHFANAYLSHPAHVGISYFEYAHKYAATLGVMQPTGDPWADNLGRIIERIAGSPWLGREWCRRAHAGKGPLWPEFRHMFGDEALQLYAQSLGVFLQRPDLTHYHAHAQRIPGGNTSYNAPPAPHMKEWNSQKHWQESKAIFERLKSTNFAECQPIP